MEFLCSNISSNRRQYKNQSTISKSKSAKFVKNDKNVRNFRISNVLAKITWSINWWPLTGVTYVCSKSKLKRKSCFCFCLLKICLHSYICAFLYLLNVFFHFMFSIYQFVAFCCNLRKLIHISWIVCCC